MRTSESRFGLRIYRLKILLALAFAFACASFSAAHAGQGGGLVSLAPSNTEILLLLGAETELGGICSECRKVLKGSSGAEKALKDKKVVGSFVAARLELLSAMKPSRVLLVNGQETLASLLKHNKFSTTVLNNNKLADIPANIRVLGEISNHAQESAKLSGEFQSSVDELRKILAKSKTKPTVLLCIWPQPIMTVGRTSFLNDVITECGGTNVAATFEKAYPQLTSEKLLLSNPHIVVAPHESRGSNFVKRYPWASLQAIKRNRVFFLPDPASDYLSRPTPRIIFGLYWLASRIHPELDGELKQWLTASRSKLGL